MTAADEITAWIDGIRDGDSFAAQALWSAYFEKLTRVAARQLAGARTAARDGEDIALSAIKSFCLAAEQGRFEKLIDRESLWPLLVSIAAHKSVDAMRHENSKKRGGTGTAGDADLHGGRLNAELSADQFLSRGPSPEMAAELSEQFQLLLTRLDQSGDPMLRPIAVGKFSGQSTTEIASQLDCARRTIERKMTLIRRLLAEQMDVSSDSKGGV
ncbi:RNA polymerase subunit sigma-70 [Stieleria sp. JC731]|uniref:ECF-type sigma factor n=1 Tax=Pirellulaceae TaxID=2691357 RepID=UPI001E46AD03|nr:ECF-type sigma factor [Stieleria sp. JC731]MCC9599718.1 RNA polymerase subunit sigma-70 [Stieleria sp. JC731]